MKKAAFQQELGLPPEDPLEEIRSVILLEKECAAELKKQVKEQGVTFRDARALLEELRVVLFELQQGNLFDGTDAGEVYEKDDNEYKSEVFEELRGLLGDRQAEKVVDYFSGSQIYFSKNIGITRKYREIRTAFREGATYRDLGAKYGYTESHIRNIIHRGRSK
jgi:Mor family transcriptional regulator